MDTWTDRKKGRWTDGQTDSQADSQNDGRMFKFLEFASKEQNIKVLSC